MPQLRLSGDRSRIDRIILFQLWNLRFYWMPPDIPLSSNLSSTRTTSMSSPIYRWGSRKISGNCEHFSKRKGNDWVCLEVLSEVIDLFGDAVEQISSRNQVSQKKIVIRRRKKKPSFDLSFPALKITGFSNFISSSQTPQNFKCLIQLTRKYLLAQSKRQKRMFALQGFNSAIGLGIANTIRGKKI